MVVKSVKLNSGYEMPMMGFGTWLMDNQEELAKALEYTYDAGYRHIDTAMAYNNETIVGDFLKTKNRSEIFITTKLWNTDHHRVKEACEESLKKLGLDFIDLYLIHWPVAQGSQFDAEKVWQQMEELVAANKVRSIGVSNFGVKNLTKVLQTCKIKPAVNQIELHVHWPQSELRQFCSKHGIVVGSYSSLSSSLIDPTKTVRNDPDVMKLAKSKGVPPSVILLSFCVTLGCPVIPRSRSKHHIEENFNLIDLSDADMDLLHNIKTRVRYVDPPFGPGRFD